MYLRCGAVAVLLAASCSKPAETELVAWRRQSQVESKEALAALPPPALPFAGLPDKLEFASGSWKSEVAFPGLSFDDPVAIVQAPRTSKIFVSEREGRIYSFDNDPGAVSKQLALDLSDVNQGEADCGLLGVAFHPEFGAAESRDHDHVYLHYEFSESPIVGTRPLRNKSLRMRLSRFTVDRATFVIARDSELVLIDQKDDNLNHQGGGMFFHPRDGFLYLTVGDEGDCALGNCQRIDKDLFAGVLRIDVDMRGGAISHPIPRQPDTGTSANYFVPNDNPFVGQSGVLEEFYALGLRSPHRMTYDAQDDLAWIGDVGEANREEVDVLKRAGNYQWPAFEGFRPVPVLEQRAKLPLPEPQGVWTNPVLDFPHDEAGAVIGGHVYRGARLPDLRGRYVFGDYMTGRIWALSYRREGDNVVAGDLELLLTTPFNSASGGITTFGVDAQNELYFSTIGKEARIHRLAPSKTFANAPKLLSQVGGVAAKPPTAASTQPYDVHGYDVQNPLWSDGARKHRWLALPRGQKVAFEPRVAWRFPAGAVFVKHFDIALDERRPAEATPLETRFLVARADGTYYGVTYKWNDQADDAELVLERKTRDLTVTLANGDTRRQRYEYPSPDDCLVCHNANAGYVLGVRTEQLNRALPEGLGSSENQLAAWSRAGVFSEPLPEGTLDEYPRLARLDDAEKSLEERVRSYWASNCSMCHGVDRQIRATWDARYATELASQRVISGEVAEVGVSGAAVVVPGDPQRSAMFLRSSTADRRKGAMPPLGHRRVDEPYVDLLTRWIQSLGPPPAPAAPTVAGPAGGIDGGELFFGAEGDGVPLLGRGWSGPEKWGVWSDEPSAHLVLPLADGRTITSLDLHLGAFVVPLHPSLRVQCSINGVLATSWDFDQAHNSGWRTIPVPEAALKKARQAGMLDLELKIQDPGNPKRLGMSKDDRELGLALRRLKVTRAP